MNRITQFPTMFRISPDVMMHTVKAKDGGPVCTNWWIEQIELRIGQCCTEHGVDEYGYLCMQFLFISEHDRLIAEQVVQNLSFIS